jgi:hypothetical protein
MRQIYVAALGATALLLSGCFGEDDKKAEAPPNDFVMVANKAAVDYKVQVTTRHTTEIPLPFKAVERIEFPATESKVVQVKAISLDPDWNDCISSVNVGQTLNVIQVGEIVECRPE